ncbi:hypothetical protein Cadr_000018416, partial [Camelus dromedarius]
MDDPKGDFSTLYQMASSCQRLGSEIQWGRESLTYGLHHLRPTSCGSWTGMSWRQTSSISMLCVTAC